MAHTISINKTESEYVAYAFWLRTDMIIFVFKSDFMLHLVLPTSLPDTSRKQWRIGKVVFYISFEISVSYKNIFVLASVSFLFQCCWSRQCDSFSPSMRLAWGIASADWLSNHLDCTGRRRLAHQIPALQDRIPDEQECGVAERDGGRRVRHGLSGRRHVYLRHVQLLLHYRWLLPQHEQTLHKPGPDRQQPLLWSLYTSVLFLCPSLLLNFVYKFRLRKSANPLQTVIIIMEILSLIHIWRCRRWP